MAEAFDILIRNTSQVLCCTGDVRGPAERALAAIPAGAVGLRGAQVAWLGPEAALPPGAVGEGTRILDAQGGLVTPGLVDPHTHVVFAGERSKEFAQRCAGATYLEIAQAGGGIASTVAATRTASEEQLIALALPRLGALLAQGVTTVEIKSGYGLDVENELKQLRVIRRLQGLHPATLVPTFLALHALPPELKERRGEWISLVEDTLLPRVAAEGLAAACDVFVEQSAFTADEARRVLRKARALGLQLRLHVDQLTPGGGGAQLAAELNAASADHLEQISAAGIAALAAAGTVAVLAPTATLFVKARPYAPGRALREAGVPVALCTNLNPGSAMSASVSLAMGLSCLENGLTPEEALLGFTRCAGLALGLPHAGALTVGGPADIAVFRHSTPAQLPYHLGESGLAAVFKGGRQVGGPLSLRHSSHLTPG